MSTLRRLLFHAFVSTRRLSVGREETGEHPRNSDSLLRSPDAARTSRSSTPVAAARPARARVIDVSPLAMEDVVRLQDGTGLGNNVTVSRSALANALDKPGRGMVGLLHFRGVHLLSRLQGQGEHEQP